MQTAPRFYDPVDVVLVFQTPEMPMNDLTAEIDHLEFSVHQFFSNGTSECVRDHVGAEEAVKAAKHYTESVGVKLGLVDRVIITDGDDYCCFEWKRGLGVTFK